MKSSVQSEYPEVERYELAESPAYLFELNRREFVQTLGAGLLISVALPDLFAQRRGRAADASVQDRLHIGRDGTITVFTSKVEVGQGSRTELTMAAAEELGLPIEQVQLVMADTDRGPNDGGTAGSRTTPDAVPAIRRGCATARQMLIEHASKKFRVDTGELKFAGGKVQKPGEEQTFSYADLASDPDALKGETPGVTLKAIEKCSILGTPVGKINGRDIVTGSHRYPSDIIRPGMLYGKVVRAPAYNSELESVDLTAVRKEPGLVVVQDGNFIGVAAKNSFEAEKWRDEIENAARWKSNPHPGSAELFDHLEHHAKSGRRQTKGDWGNEKGSREFKAAYHVAFIQHAPMEPRAAVAEWEGDHLTVWTGSQMPGRVRDDLARAFQISPARVRVIVPDTGGGFGGKHSGECALEASRLAKAAGHPVHLRWTREEEFKWAYFRPAGVIHIRSIINDDGRITHWEQININSGGSALETPYEIENQATEFRGSDSPLRGGSYRGLASTANVFARESMMDELAAALNANPLEFRMKHIKNDRLKRVLEAAAEKFDWNGRWKNGGRNMGYGLSCGTEKGSYAACCARVKIGPDGVYRVEEIVEAFECGTIQNPKNLKAQVEGAIMQGLGGATREEMQFAGGKMLNPRFSKYRVPRFKDLPRIESVLVDRRDLPAVGAGETPIIGIAPATANAIYNAVQVRIRSLPIRNEKIRAA